MIMKPLRDTEEEPGEKTQENDHTEEEPVEKTQENDKMKSIISDMIDQDGEDFLKMETEHNEQLYHHINHAIQIVLKDQTKNGGNFTDSIDDLVKKNYNKETYITCKNCKTLNENGKEFVLDVGKETGIKEAKAIKEYQNNTTQERNGVPTDDIWQTVCRNNTLLENIKDHSLNVLGLSSSKSGTRSLCIDDAVLAYRVLLRKTNYLSKPTDHTSISGMALDEGLIGFTQAALGKRIHILKSKFLGLPLQPEHYTFRHPVPVTPFEREKLYSTSNMTINEISKLLNQITDPFSSRLP
ncbi:unnamed protein product [Mytilus edulis]|uniref:Uncharacterized protein n=1 Tax=Mytilus edulis TaxID=6550 RepID=A0A8S3TRB2_MYTED|nr:unnamed protein product [Mytilus edulis]